MDKDRLEVMKEKLGYDFTAELLGTILELDGEQWEYLVEYEKQHGEDALVMLVRDAVEGKRKKKNESLTPSSYL